MTDHLPGAQLPENEAFLGIDVEGANHNWNTPMPAIGVSFWHRHVHRKADFFIEVPEEFIDKKCKEEFWDQQFHHGQKLWDWFQEQATDEKTAVGELADFIRSVESKQDVKVRVLTDTTSRFDVSGISRLLGKYEERKPLWFDARGEYRGFSNPCDEMWRLPQRKTIQEMARTYFPVTHVPSDDADNIVAQWILLEYGHAPAPVQFYINADRASALRLAQTPKSPPRSSE